ncbi:non-ribosomal peptide synthetase [Chitinophaga sp. HK235]|uniref:non-ribosomal peptide synthetase n=1 Tax=Chitinophaga sp. HK235 TaxID=2952571 RepID=UPI001BA5F917|nr:non-ribosomal peptide synthetase [Chitinophaga sp. HK235]
MLQQIIPLHPAQQDVYMDQLINAENPYYNIGGYTKLTGNLCRETFIKAVKSLPAVHDAFRMRFDPDSQEPGVCFEDEYQQQELTELDFSNDRERAGQWIKELFNIPFVIKPENPLAEHYLVRVAPDEYWYVLKCHHLVTDGYGVSLSLHYLAAKYKALLTDDPGAFTYPSYKKEIQDAAAYYNTAAYAADREYWQEIIPQKPVQVLRKMYQQQENSHKATDTLVTDLTAAEKDLLDDIQAKTGSSLQQLTIAALMIYFASTSGQSELVFGTSLHKRRGRVQRNVVGMFAGILPFKGMYDGEMTLADLIKGVVAAQKRDYRHQNYTIGDLSRRLKINAADDHLVEVVVNYAALDFELDFGEDLQAVFSDVPNNSGRYPLEFWWRDYSEHHPLQIKIDFQLQYFTTDEVRLFLQRILLIFSQFGSGLQEKVKNIRVIPEQELALLKSFNNTTADYPYNGTIVSLFREQAARIPEATAVVFEHRFLTYRTLDEQSDQLAYHLRAKGVTTESLVPVCVDRSLEMMIGILGILKAGGAYVPVDPHYPAARINYMLEDIRCTVALADSTYQHLFGNVTTVCIDTLNLSDKQVGAAIQSVDINPGHLAYVMYTSGSTGQPKGAMVTHLNVVSLVRNAGYTTFTPEDAILCAGSISFDATTFEYWGALLNGGQLVLSPRYNLLDAGQLKQDLHGHQITKMFFSASWFNQLVDTDITVFEKLQAVLVGGEKISEKHIGKLRSVYSHIDIINGYGPTENTTFSLCYSITKHGLRENTPIGVPLNNRQAYVLDSSMQIMPVGVAGEIYVGGAGVTRGYLNRPALTAERFIADKFSGGENKWLYKTGDLGRWLPDGNVEYLGRIDDQVKIRGHRIEPGEIESVLSSCEMVSQVAVVARADAGGNMRLIAYVVPEGNFNRDGIIAYLKDRLPEYMIPARFIEQKLLPLNPNGKVDRHALPEPDDTDMPARSYVAPRNETEALMANIWQELLHTSKVGIYDNFFELGGDSIITIQLVSRMRRAGLELQPNNIFRHQTIAGLSALLDQPQQHTVQEEQGQLKGNSGLLPVQQMYFEAPYDADNHFNQYILLTVNKHTETASLTQAIQLLVAYHDALRFVYKHDKKGWEQHYGAFEGGLETIDLRGLPEERLHAEIASYEQYYQRQPDILKGKLLCAALLLTPDTESHNRLLLVVHHLAIDGVSWRILLSDLELLLKTAPQDREKILGPKGTSYRQWLHALEAYGQGKRLQEQTGYWKQVVQQQLPLRTDTSYNGDVTFGETSSYSNNLDVVQTQRLLQESSQAYHTEINDILLTALALTLSEWNGASAVSVALEGHGREEVTGGTDISHTVGWFTSIYPVLLDAGSSSSSGALLKDIKEQLRCVPDKGIGYGVLKYMHKADFLQEVAYPDVVFNYLGQLDSFLSGGDHLNITGDALRAGIGDGYTITEKIAVNCIVQYGKLQFYWRYSTRHFSPESVATLADNYLSHLHALIDHCVANAATPAYTPADYGLGGVVSNEELDDFLNDTYRGVVRRPQVERLYRLSALQEGMLFHRLYNEQAGLYIEQLNYRLSVQHEELFIQSWKQLLQRHSILRSGFYHGMFSIPVQCVYHKADLPVTVLDYTDLDSEEQENALLAYEAEDRRQGLDFTVAPLMRVALIRLKADYYHVLWTFHHILLDGWSLQILMEELFTTYDELVAGKPLPVLPDDNYEDYIRYQQQVDKEQSELYWKNYLTGIAETGTLSFTAAAADRTKGQGVYAEKEIWLDTGLTDQIQQYSQQHRITVNTLMQGVWSYLLYHYTGCNDVAFGVTVSGRPEDLPGIEQRVGLYINTLPLYTKIDPSANITQWLHELQGGQLQSREYQYVGLSELQQWVEADEELFDSFIAFENFPVSQSWRSRTEGAVLHEQMNYPLGIRVTTGREISILFGYNTNLLDSAYIERIQGHFVYVLQQITTTDIRQIRDLAVLTKEEQHQLLEVFNNTKVIYGDDKTVVDYFTVQANRTPDATALVSGDTRWTYGKLHEQSDRLAQYLRSLGVRKETLVPVCMGRTPEIIVAMLGIMKAGGAYVPIDPAYPPERINYMLTDTGAEIIITSNDIILDLTGRETPVKVIVPDDAIAYPVTETGIPLDAEQLANVIYTSGSTGNPKGVMIAHKGLMNMVHWYTKAYDVTSSSRATVVTGVGFDVFGWEVWPHLCSGATVFMLDDTVRSSPHDLERIYARHEITHSLVFTAIFGDVIREIRNKPLALKYLLTGGDRLGPTDITGLTCRLFNNYGPTENSVITTYYELSEKDKDVIPPIGIPVNNTIVYIVNNEQQLCPVGIWGELCISGTGVSRGYLQQEALTAGKFVANPFDVTPGARMYKTGDICRWLPNGNIEYLGRRDEQVKIRGFRIELGEIESALSGSGLVREAVVLARQGSDGSNYLAGYVVPEGNFDRAAIITYLNNRLPGYMVPAVLLELDALPLTANGKIDKKALPDPDGKALSAGTEAMPRNKTEELLKKIWLKLLDREEVGIYDNFFDLGGHSLLAIRLTTAIGKELNVEVPVNVVFEYPTIAALSDQLSEKIPVHALPAKTVYERPEYIPLSFSQERLWFIDQLEGSVPYHMSGMFRLKGRLHHEALARALQTIVNRHEVLRTVIKPGAGIPYQHILDKDLWQFSTTDHEPYQYNPDTFQSYVRFLGTIPFDLSRDHMLRAHLLKIAADEHALVLIIHHIAADAWSVSILMNELIELYRAFESGTVPLLSPLAMQYADFAIWQRTYQEGALLNKKLDYWKNKLKNTAVLQLPTDYPRPAIQSTRGTILWFRLDSALTDQLQALSLREGVTMFMTLLTAFKVLLYRYGGQEDLCVGTSIAGRTQQETENLIGFFLNTLPLRSDLSDNPSFTALLHQVKETTITAYNNQEVPFEMIVEAVEKKRDLSRTSLFQVMFDLLNTPDIPDLKLGDLQLAREDVERTTTQFDLSFCLEADADGLKGYAEYCTDLFDAATIERMTRHFEQLLRSVIAAPAQQISTLNILTTAEKQTLQTFATGAVIDLPADQTVVTLFEEQVQRYPDAVAIQFEETEITYHSLHERTNQLAYLLRSKGIGADSKVPVFIDRCPEMIIAVLSIWKAGGAYVPIDPKFPEERVRYILEETAAQVVVTNQRSSVLLPADITAAVISADEEDILNNQPRTALPPVATQQHLAYVLYTSGSTGKPKGVLVEHAGLLNHLLAMIEEFDMNPSTILAFTAPYTFDISVWQMVNALVCGGRTVIYTESLIHRPDLFIKTVEEQGVTLLQLVPSYLTSVLQEESDVTLQSLDYLLVTGEAVTVSLLEQWFAHERFGNITVANAYGPTEASDDVSFYFMNEAPDVVQVPVGTPIRNLRMYVLDNNLQLCPQGVPGEICVAGLAVARGYLNRPELTAAKFVEDPFCPGERMYRTGDLGRWLPDGNMEYIGRADDQVKVRGFRIELGEIEHIVLKSELVSQCVVTVKQDAAGNNLLVGYIVPGAAFSKDALLAYLKGKLPEYMIPAVFVKLDQLPLTANRKIDKKALPEPDSGAYTTDVYVAPADTMEQTLTDIWEHLLATPRIGTRDNFFELGGHSLLAIRVVAAVRKKLEVELTVRDIFIYPTVSQLAAYVKGLDKSSQIPPVKAVQRSERIPLSYSQERLWFIDQLEGSLPYHIPAVLRLHGRLDVAALSSALRTIVNRHEVLRTVMVPYEGMPYQQVLAADRWELTHAADTLRTADESTLSAYLAVKSQETFDLSQDHMLRAHLVTQGAEDHLLLVTMHHIASDGWSTGIIVRELAALYNAYAAGHSITLPPLPVQYADYSIWQRSYVSGEVLEKKLDYWKSQLQGFTTLQLPGDYIRPSVQSSRGGIHWFHLDERLLSPLKQLSRQHGTTLFMTLLAAFKVLLHRYSGQEDICVGTSVAGRTSEDVEGLIGFFVNTLVLRSHVSSEQSFASLLEQVKHTTLSAYDHQEAPFEKVVEAVVRERDISRHPLFQVMFELQNTPEVPDLELNGLRLSQESLSHSTTQFDLTLSLEESATGLSGYIEYCADLFTGATIAGLQRHYEQLLWSVVNNPSEETGLLEMMSGEEKTLLVETFNDTRVAYPSDNTLVGLFREQAGRTPDNTALLYEGVALSYRELEIRTDRVAAYLQSKGVQSETLVPVCLERSADMVIGILGILKAGGAYVPVDPSYPAERILYMLSDTGASVILSSAGLSAQLPATDATIVLLEDIFVNTTDIAVSGLPVPRPDHLAYVIYTSGSTGVPKGVMIEHQGLLNHLYAKINTLEIDGQSVIAQTATYSFDISVWQMFAALVCGGTTVIYPSSVIYDPSSLLALTSRSGVTILELVPSYLSSLLQSGISTPLNGLRYLLVTGEEVSAALLEQWFSHATYGGIPVVNAYGPTEASDDITHHMMSSAPSGSTVPLGRPVQNLRIYVLDKRGCICPVGVWGEICVSGIGVGRGYLNRASLTEEKFVADPFVQGARMYRTGDLGRWLVDGTIAYGGRLDEQVKIHGYRIELGEVESVLSSNEQVHQAVVVAQEDESGHRRLVGYVVPRADYDKETVQSWLKGRLPAYMVPAVLVTLDALPLTPNGKVDRKSLPLPDDALLQTENYVAPETATEQLLAGIWQELLGTERIGVHDNFFELGGHSLLVMRLNAAIHKELGIEIPVSIFFQLPTIDALAKYINVSQADFTPAFEEMKTIKL